MPNLPNAKKSLRQNVKRRAHNKQYKNRIKTVARKIDDLIKEGKKEEASKLLPVYFKAVDKAAKKNILHKNTASRKKSLYSKKIYAKKELPSTAPSEASGEERKTSTKERAAAKELEKEKVEEVGEVIKED